MSESVLPELGVVVIGRNEGRRLEVCLASAVGLGFPVVYVDSGSTDNSVELALGLGVDVVALDVTIAFTAARARNAGFEKLLAIHPRTEFVQFVDGDCEFVSGWLQNGQEFLMRHPEVAVVCGRRRERYPERTIYNRLCDYEWDTPVGETKACGGDAMMRVAAFQSVGGYRNDLIAGEEPELCVRLRASGWKVWRLDMEMTRHDAEMLRFSQWWRRSMRAGYAYANGAWLHGKAPERHWVAESSRAWFWGLGIPILTVVGLFLWGNLALVLLSVYPVQFFRLTITGQRSYSENFLNGFFLVLGKFPEMLGQLSFVYHKLRNRSATLIEYKK